MEADAPFLVSHNVWKSKLPIFAGLNQIGRHNSEELQGILGTGEPGANLLRTEKQRHPVMDVMNRGIGLCSQDHKAVYSFHIVKDACQIQRLARYLKEILVLFFMDNKPIYGWKRAVGLWKRKFSQNNEFTHI